MNQYAFKDILTISKLFLKGVKGLLLTIGVTDHRWGAPTVLTQKCIDSLN
jgi:hypothetical protein